jgi:low affinity Fe/Cu permease
VVASTVFIAIWLALGPTFHWSDSWQLSMNSPITLVELYLAIFTLAAANRVEKRNRLLLEKIEAYEEQELKLLQK